MREIKTILNHRLAWFREDSFIWDAHWRCVNAENLFPPYEKSLGMLEFMLSYLPHCGKILEAGCGMGQIVHLLRNNGFDCEGVDSASETIARVHSLKPDLPIRIADLLSMDVPDSTYEAIVSLGVVEHREEGPSPFFAESFRILKPGGIAIFTVPYFSPLRRVKALLGFYKKRSRGVFYQYAFKKTEFKKLLNEAGFEVFATHYYDAWKACKDEVLLFNYIHNNFYSSNFVNFVNNQQWFLPLVAHMVAFVCRKQYATH